MGSLPTRTPAAAKAGFPISEQPSDSLTVVDNRTGKAYQLPIENNAVRAMDFKKIRAPARDAASQAEHGLRLYDPGFQNTACMESAITYVDGQAGEISYRGTPVSELYKAVPYEHVSHLLIFGRLPSPKEAEAFNRALATSPLPKPHIFAMIRAMPRDVHPVTACESILSAHIASNPQAIPAACGGNLYKGDAARIDAEIPRFLGAYSAITAAVFCHLHGREFRPPRPEYSFIENTLHMMGEVDPATGKPDPRVLTLLGRMLILTGDHEITNSTAAALHAASSLSDPYSCAVAAMAAGLGPLHIGAMEVAYRQLEDVGDVAKVPQLMEDVKAQKRRLYGYGHRIYKVVDPRSLLIRECIREAGCDNDRVLAVAQEIDRIASQDEYFTSRNLCVNPDLFLSFTYKAIGLPTSFVTSMVVLGRMPGLMAHWREAMLDPKPRMWRPLQLYTGKVPALRR